MDPYPSRSAARAQTLEPGATQSYDTPPEGVIKFRELDGQPTDLLGRLESA